jgi:hypothetical protein
VITLFLQTTQSFTVLTESIVEPTLNNKGKLALMLGSGILLGAGCMWLYMGRQVVKHINKCKGLGEQNQKLQAGCKEVLKRKDTLALSYTMLTKKFEALQREKATLIDQYEVNNNVSTNKYYELFNKNCELIDKYNELVDQYSALTHERDEMVNQHNKQLTVAAQLIAEFDHGMREIIGENLSLSQYIQGLRKKIEILEKEKRESKDGVKKNKRLSALFEEEMNENAYKPHALITVAISQNIKNPEQKIKLLLRTFACQLTIRDEMLTTCYNKLVSPTLNTTRNMQGATSWHENSVHWERLQAKLNEM